MNATTPIAVEANAVVRRFPGPLGLGRGTTVLRGIDLALPEGELLGLVGPNGSGKSTLLRILAGVDRPTGGSVLVFGRDPRGEGARRAIGWLPEDSPFPRELPARELLRLLGALRGMHGKELAARADSLLERVGLADSAKRPLRTYSRGMSRRFGLAATWLHAPRLILLDEPSAGLDAQGLGVFAELGDEARARGGAPAGPGGGAPGHAAGGRPAPPLYRRYAP